MWYSQKMSLLLKLSLPITGTGKVSGTNSWINSRDKRFRERKASIKTLIPIIIMSFLHTSIMEDAEFVDVQHPSRVMWQSLFNRSIVKNSSLRTNTINRPFYNQAHGITNKNIVYTVWWLRRVHKEARCIWKRYPKTIGLRCSFE